MRPIKLTMQAFGSYAKKEVINFDELGNGIFLITGDTGAGKTTIFDAITFALYGNTSGQKRSGRMMRSKYANEDIETFVELTFIYRDKIYTINRSPEYFRYSKKKSANGEYVLVKQTAKVELVLPDGLVFNGKLKETDEKIIEIMGLNIDQFTQIAMLAQGDFLKLLHSESKDRKAIFTKIFNTTFYNDAGYVLKEYKNKNQSKLIDSEKEIRNAMLRAKNLKKEGIDLNIVESLQIEEALNFIQDSINESKSYEKSLNIKKEDLDKSKTKFESIFNMINNILEDEKQDRIKKNLIESNIEKAYKEKELLSKKLIDIDDFAKNHLEDYQKQIIKLEDDLPKYDELSDLQKELIKNKNEISIIDDQINLNKNKLEKIKRKYDDTSKKAKNAIDIHKEAQEKYDSLLNAYYSEQAGILATSLKEETPCPVCGSLVHPSPAKLSPNAPTKKMVDDGKNTRDMLDKSREKALRDLEASKLEYDEYQKEYDGQNSALENKKNMFTANQIALQEKLEQYTKNLSYESKSELNTYINKLKSQIETYNYELKETKNKIAKTDVNIGEQKGSLNTINEKLEGYESKKKECLSLEEISINIKKISDELMENSREAKQVFNLLENNQKIFDELSNIKKLYSKQKNEFLLVEHLYRTYSGNLNSKSKLDFETYIQRQYFKKIIQSANKRLYILSNNEFILKCRNLEDLNGGNASVGLDLDVESLVNNSVRDVKTLSGGESFMAALSMALGLADVIGQTAGAIKLETMFIDEGFGNLDDNSREAALRVLTSLAGDSQMIGIISHVNELKEGIEKKIIVKKTNKGSTTSIEIQ